MNYSDLEEEILKDEIDRYSKIYNMQLKYMGMNEDQASNVIGAWKDKTYNFYTSGDVHISDVIKVFQYLNESVECYYQDRHDNHKVKIR